MYTRFCLIRIAEHRIWYQSSPVFEAARPYINVAFVNLRIAEVKSSLSLMLIKLVPSVRRRKICSRFFDSGEKISPEGTKRRTNISMPALVICTGQRNMLSRPSCFSSSHSRTQCRCSEEKECECEEGRFISRSERTHTKARTQTSLCLSF
jgi:hypothetical protein